MVRKEMRQSQPDSVFKEEDVVTLPGDHHEPRQRGGRHFDDPVERALGAQRDVLLRPKFRNKVNLPLLEEWGILFDTQNMGLQKWKNLVLQKAVEENPLIWGQVPVVQKEHPVGLQLRQDLASERGAELLLLARNDEVDIPQKASGSEAQLLQLLLLQPKQASKRSHPNPKKLIQIRRENGQEVEALQKGDPGVHGFLEDPPVECQPGDLPIQIAFGPLFFPGRGRLVQLFRKLFASG